MTPPPQGAVTIENTLALAADVIGHARNIKINAHHTIKNCMEGITGSARTARIPTVYEVLSHILMENAQMRLGQNYPHKSAFDKLLEERNYADLANQPFLIIGEDGTLTRGDAYIALSEAFIARSRELIARCNGYLQAPKVRQYSERLSSLISHLPAEADSEMPTISNLYTALAADSAADRACKAVQEIVTSDSPDVLIAPATRETLESLRVELSRHRYSLDEGGEIAVSADVWIKTPKGNNGFPKPDIGFIQKALTEIESTNILTAEADARLGADQKRGCNPFVWLFG